LLSGNALRQKFLDYFNRQDHQILPSASLIPKDDPTLLLTVAGMVPFKPYFLGQAAPPHPRVTSVQKCLRTADLEIVGKTARHHTFFEMLGNFSFGDYFKKEAIDWSWDYLTRELGLPPGDLWITVYTDDDDAADLWHRIAGVPPERIVRLGEDSNFWAAGPVGPCGPCSEIIMDLGPQRGCGSPGCGVDCECGRYLEIWNLVFMQYYRDEDGKLTSLPRPSIDTGMGLERIASVVQGVASNFETDLIFPLVQEAAGLAGIAFGSSDRSDVALKVIADHARAVAFLIADGVAPSNEGRGYVLRRILRRAIRYGRLLGIEDAFLGQVTGRAIALYQDTYRELLGRRDYIQRVVSMEEERFGETLEQGLQILHEHLDQITRDGGVVLPGRVAFKLYDTFGFPLELTREILAEQGLTVDLAGFREAMEEQRERARLSRPEAAHMAAPAGCPSGGWARHPGAWDADAGTATDFRGYHTLSTSSEIRGLVSDGARVEEASEGAMVQVLLDATPFYPESGGQVGDQGLIKGPAGMMVVADTRKVGSLIVHQGYVRQGILRQGDLVLAEVDSERRRATARNHTATHLLHRSLRIVLGEHVRQTGSYVGPERLRFDFSHFAPLTPQELQEVEDLVNRMILGDLLVKASIVDRETALRQGATALFEEKYGEEVRMVAIDDFSLELCGGTHVRHTSELALFKILSDTGIGAGTRRIEALTGEELRRYWSGRERLLAEAAERVKTPPDNLPARLEQLQQQLRAAEREAEELRGKALLGEVGAILDKSSEVDGVRLLAARVQARDAESLRSLGDQLKQRLGSGVIILGSESGGKVNLVSFVTPDLIEREGLHAGGIIREVARVVGGGGGGKADMAQAGGKDPARLDEALQEAARVVRRHLNAGQGEGQLAVKEAGPARGSGFEVRGSK
jgi:alanyl-tRNA synthetase